MKPRFHKSSRSVLFCAALLSPIVYHSTARAQSGTWNNPALASTGTLTSNITPGTEADLVWTGNPLAFGDLIQLTGTVPGGFTASTYYFVVSSLGDVIQLSATPGGLAILATTAINNGTAVAANKPWQSPASWAGGTIADGFNGVATFGGFDFTAPEVVGVGAFTTIGTLNFTDSTAPASVAHSPCWASANSRQATRSIAIFEPSALALPP